MAELIMADGQRHHETLVHGIGDVWMSCVADAAITGAASASTTFDLHLGCLNGNWMTSMEPQIEEIARSCGSGQLSIPTSKKYTVSLNSRDLTPMGQAALMGHKIAYGADATETILVQEKLTSAPIAVAFTITLASLTTIGVWSSLYKVVSVYKKSDGTFWFPAAAAASATYNYSITDAGVMTFEAGELAEDFVIVVQFYSQMEAGDVKSWEDGITFANNVDITLTWLRKTENGPNVGKKGYLVGVFKNCTLTSTIEIGGDAQSIINQDLEFSVNFQDEGDIEYHWKTLE